MATRDANQGAGVESGLSKKEKIGNYVPATSNMKNYKPKQAPAEKAPDGHKIK